MTTKDRIIYNLLLLKMGIHFDEDTFTDFEKFNDAIQKKVDEGMGEEEAEEYVSSYWGKINE